MRNGKFRDIGHTGNRMMTNKSTNQVFVKGKKFLLVIRHSLCPSYSPVGTKSIMTHKRTKC
jgi:hypothetical protein